MITRPPRARMFLDRAHRFCCCRFLKSIRNVPESAAPPGKTRNALPENPQRPYQLVAKPAIPHPQQRSRSATPPHMVRNDIFPSQESKGWPRGNGPEVADSFTFVWLGCLPMHYADPACEISKVSQVCFRSSFIMPKAMQAKKAMK